MLVYSDVVCLVCVALCGLVCMYVIRLLVLYSHTICPVHYDCVVLILLDSCVITDVFVSLVRTVHLFCVHGNSSLYYIHSSNYSRLVMYGWRRVGARRLTVGAVTSDLDH